MGAGFFRYIKEEVINLETWVEELPKEKFFPRINTEDCLVTISMLISNRINTVEKCFESFRPLLEQIPSEFIAVDTVGDENSDGSIDVARKYADKIVHFEWCDDFAAARNAMNQADTRDVLPLLKRFKILQHPF